MKTFKVRQEKGRNLRQVISKLLVRSPIEAIKEFASNSYDADAGQIQINIDLSQKSIGIVDDGEGMGEEGLVKFLQMGDSEKIGNPLTKKGRRKIGRFGIANTLLQFLGDSYQIQTWHDKTFIDGYEAFQPEPTDGIRYEIQRNLQRRHGTSLLIRDSRFVGTNHLTLPRLEDALSWELPEPSPDFKITLNGKEVKRELPDPQKEFSYKDTLKQAGPVEMKVQFYNQPVRINGIYIYVDGRAVGKPEYFELKKVLRISQNKVLISVNANELRESIVFNRSRFTEDPAFFELKKWIHQNLYKVNHIIEKETSKPLPVVVASRETIGETLRETRYLSPSSNGNRDGKPKNQESLPIPVNTKSKSNGKIPLKYDGKPFQHDGIPSVIGFNTIRRGSSSPPTTLNTRTRELTFNVDHPWYKSSDITNPDVLKMHLLLGTCFGLAEGFYLEEGGSRDYVSEFNNLCTRLLISDGVIDNVRARADSNETGRFAPSREYTLLEVVNHGVASIVTSRELVRAGVFRLHQDRVLGQEISDYIAKSKNYTPAIDLVYEWGRARVKAKKLTRERVRQIGVKINRTLTHFTQVLPFIYNIGVDRPFFLVENEKSPAFLGLLAQRAIRNPTGRETYEHVIAMNRHLYDKINAPEKEKRYVGLDDLCEIARGSPQDVFKIVGYAQRMGVSLPLEKKDGQVLYSLTHFKKARQKYLSGEKNE